MATSGKITGTAYKSGVANPDYTFWADWVRNSKSDANNTSNITVNLRIKNTAYANSAYNLDKKPAVTLKVNGAAKTPTIKIIDTRENVTCTFATWTGDVSHKSDGTLSCPIEASFTHYGSSSLTSGSLSGNANLSPTFRASDVSLVSDTVKMGSALTINIDRKSSAFTHTLRYLFGGNGGLSGTIATNVGTSKSWTVPTSFAGQIKDETSGYGEIFCDTYSGSTKIGTTWVAFTATVPDATTPTLSASSIFMGNNLTVTMNRAASSFTHTLKYKFGTKEGAIGTELGTSETWTVPLSLAKEIPTKIRGTLTITCETYNGTAKVGSRSVTVTATVPENDQTRPKVDMVLRAVCDLVEPFVGLCIKGKAKLEATFDAQSDYSTIESYALTAGSSKASGNPCTTGYLVNTGNVEVKGTVTDARGFSTTVATQITVLPYEEPSVVPYGNNKEVVCVRCTADGTPNSGGVNLLIQAGRKYSPVTSGGVQKNFCRLKYRMKKSTDGSFSSWTDLISAGTGSDAISRVISNAVPSATTSYDVQIIAEDDLDGEHTLNFVVPTDEVDFHLRKGGKGAAFGKYSELEKALEVADDWDSHFYGNVDGRVYGLGKLPEIPTGSDFDDYKEFGVWSVPYNDRAETMANCPINKAGTLRVWSGTGLGNTSGSYMYMIQEYIPYNNYCTFRRYMHFSDDVWDYGQWKVTGGIDAVVEEGQTDGWHWMKYANGIAQCWRRVSQTIDITTQWGSLYYGTTQTVFFPFTFAYVPVCTISTEYLEAENPSCFVVSNGRTTTTQAANILLARPTEKTGVDCVVVYHAIGRWKE